MRIPNLVLLLSFSVLLISALPYILHAADPAGCATCEELINAPQTGIFVLVNDIDSSNRYVNIVAYYENLSASPSRQPLNNTIVLVELTSPTGTYVLQKTYTNENGTAKFRYTAYDDECLNFKVLYCPFCVPPGVDCEGFMQCVDFAHLDTSATNADGVTTATDAVLPAELNAVKYLPSLGTASWCPPPPALAATPALCFPLILIFSLLSGALYLTGRNPFAGFNIGGMRTGQHLRYQARGRGFSFSFTQLAMAAMSVGEAAKTATKQGGGALVKREVDAANRRGVGGIWSHNAGGGKSGSFMAIQGGLQGYKSDRDNVNTQGTVQARGGGARGSTSTGTGPGGVSMTQGASGQQTSLSSGQGVSGAQILGGNTFTLSSFVRILTFIALNTTLGSAIGACYSAATWNAQAGRGGNLFSDQFSSSQQRIVDAAGSLAALRGPNGGRMITIRGGSGEDREVETFPVPGNRPREAGVTEYAIAVPQGTGAGQSVDGRAIIRVNSDPESSMKGQIIATEMRIMIPSVDKQGQPVMAPVLDKQGQPVMAPVLGKDGQPVMAPVLDKQGQPVLGEGGAPRMEPQMAPVPGPEQRMEEATIRARPPTAESNGQPILQIGAQSTAPGATQGQMEFTNLPPSQAASIMPSFQQAVNTLPPSLQTGVIATPFVESYDAHMAGISALQQTIRSEAAFEMERRSDAVASNLGANPDARDAVQQARYDVATEAMANLGLPVNDVRYGGTGELMTGVERGSSDLDGHQRGQAETVVLAVHEADESSGPRRQGIPSLTSLATPEGATMLAMAAGMDSERAGQAAEVVAPVLARMSPNDIATTNQTELAARIVATNQTREDQGLPPISHADAMAYAAVASGARDIATEFSGRIQANQGFTGNADPSGRTLSDRINGSDLDALRRASDAGHQMTPEGTGALLVSRPDVVGGYRIPDEIAQPAREMAAAENLYRAAQTPNIVAAADLVNTAVFDYATAVMVNGARRTEGALQDSEYSQATRGLDSGTYHAAIAASPFGELPARTPPPEGVPPETWAENIRPRERLNPTSIESVEINRRENIDRFVTTGDYSSARAEVGAAVAEYNTAARAARALGDEDTARTMETAATAYASALPRIDSFETDHRSRPTGPASPEGGAAVGDAISGAGNPAEIGLAVAEVRAGHSMRRTDDMIEVKEHIDARIPRDKRPPELYDQARAMPLTPTVPGLGQTPRDTG